MYALDSILAAVEKTPGYGDYFVTEKALQPVPPRFGQARYDEAQFAAMTDLRQTDYVGLFPAGGFQRGIRWLFPQGTTTKSSITYNREVTASNNAAAVDHGAPKPESGFTGANHTSPVATLAHWVKLSRQIMEDLPALRSQLEVRLLSGIVTREDQQLLFGTGTAGQLEGIMPQIAAASGLTIPVAPSAIPAAVGKAAIEVSNAGYTATGVVLNPADWLGIQQTASAGYYPFLAPTLWGLAVATTTQMPVGNFLVGAFYPCAQVYDREQAGMELASENVDDFVKDLLTARAEERLALAVYQPSAFRKAG